MLLRWPGVVKPGSTNTAITSLLDLAPTFTRAVGQPLIEGTHGKDLTPLLKGETPKDWRKSFYYHYYEYPGPHDVARHYGVVTDRYKLVYYYGLAKPEWELFDRQTDPQELKSVWADTTYAETRKELEVELARLRKELKVPEVDAR